MGASQVSEPALGRGEESVRNASRKDGPRVTCPSSAFPLTEQQVGLPRVLQMMTSLRAALPLPPNQVTQNARPARPTAARKVPLPSLSHPWPS